MIQLASFINLIRKGDFKELFISELGWNNARGQSELSEICVDEVDYTIKTIAERSGFQILYCEVDEIPTQSIAKKIDTKLRIQAADYICIYRKKNTAHDLWCVPVRSTEKRNLVMVEYEKAQADFLYSKIKGFYFELEEESNIVDLCAKVQSAFAVNSEKITKEFYAGFKKQHTLFSAFISGIDDHIPAKDNRNKQWYTSVMLNRLMFCYFIQKKGFLDGRTDYLQEKLKWVRSKEGKAVFPNFQSFYRSFLTRLFHDGLNSPKHNRDFVDYFGRIPYLNGGMFDEHQLERDYADIDIADDAFESLFAFFDTWRWHLDTRVTASGKDINPDVLGYIFEQYINDRAQMGAYYTKEDITEYIGRNCILPFLFDKVAATSSQKDFESDGFVWQTLKASADKYVFDAVKKGYADFDKIPKEIARGIISPKMHKEYSQTPVGQHTADHVPLSELRSDWNQPTGEKWALPTEIWRETIERLQRCRDILSKIAEGKITSINDFITYNLDIRRFAIDIIEKAEDSRFIKHFYEALRNVSILDPTCGSGAFLFAAMNILEPLYEACIDRMQVFNKENPKLFKAELDEINGKYRSNIQYFIFKSIILRNLYGVDIMVEATEIAKLRLFLKMVAVVDVDHRAPNLGLDPLPDIDFNIRCGNTLVGYANKAELDRDLNDNQGDWEIQVANDKFRKEITTEMEKVATAYEEFKVVQLTQDENMAAFKQAKDDLRNRLSTLNDILNHRMHQANTCIEYQDWLSSHQPFHWLAEFYGIIQGNGGFDVIIGNPPYVEYKKMDSNYTLRNYKTLSCGNLYAFVLERSKIILSHQGYVGMIIPMSGHSTTRMTPLCDNVYNDFRLHLHLNLSADAHPQKLFEGVKFRLCIFFGNNTHNGSYSSKYLRWTAIQRPILFSCLINFQPLGDYTYYGIIPKIPSIVIIPILKKVSSHKQFFGLYKSGQAVYYHNTPVNWIRAHNWIPYFSSEKKGENASTQLKSFLFDSNTQVSIAMNILSSSLFFLWWLCHSDCYHLNNSELYSFGYTYCPKDNDKQHKLNSRLVANMKSNAKRRVYIYEATGRVEYDEFYMKLSKPIIDQIDTVLAEHYGFTEEELDFIINYDIKYRMGDELNSEE